MVIDFFFSNSNHPSLTTTKRIESIECAWMVLYSQLGHLCVDERPAVRKSAGQTLFSVISSHGAALAVHALELDGKTIGLLAVVVAA